MRGPRLFMVVVMMSVLMGSAASAQQPKPPDQKREIPVMEQREAAETSKMEHMADAMASMAQMCETMMEREMATYAWKIAAASVFGVITSVALLLLIVLEIQWIRLLNIRIRKEGRGL